MYDAINKNLSSEIRNTMLCLVVHQKLNIAKGLSHIEEVCCATHYQTTLKHPNLKLFLKVNWFD